MSFYISCSFVAWPTVGEVLLVTNWFILKVGTKYPNLVF